MNQHTHDNPIEHNRRAWDQRVRDGRAFARPVSDEEIDKNKARIDPWVVAEGVKGKTVLCLAAGGGRQSVLYAMAGGLVTVVDVSAMQLDLDRQMARERGLMITPVQASMDDLSMLVDASFDIVIQPVSTCYLPDIAKIYGEVARVMKIGGLYVSQHKQPTSLQAHIRTSDRGYEILEPYYRSGPLPPVSGSPHREPGTLEYLHRWDQIVGMMCRSGFVIEDLSEPHHGDATQRPGTFKHRSHFIPPYVRIKARRVPVKPKADAATPRIIH